MSPLPTPTAFPLEASLEENGTGGRQTYLTHVVVKAPAWEFNRRFITAGHILLLLASYGTFTRGE